MPVIAPRQLSESRHTKSYIIAQHTSPFSYVLLVILTHNYSNSRIECLPVIKTITTTQRIALIKEIRLLCLKFISPADLPAKL